MKNTSFAFATVLAAAALSSMSFNAIADEAATVARNATAAGSVMPGVILPSKFDQTKCSFLAKPGEKTQVTLISGQIADICFPAPIVSAMPDGIVTVTKVNAIPQVLYLSQSYMGYSGSTVMANMIAYDQDGQRYEVVMSLEPKFKTANAQMMPGMPLAQLGAEQMQKTLSAPPGK